MSRVGRSRQRPPSDADTDRDADRTADRKQEHLDLALRADVGFAHLTTGLERLRLRPRALPERDLAAVDLSTQALGRRLAAPLLISCMTGGTGAAGPVNRALAAAAQEHGVALGLGSGRAALEDAHAFATFQVRDVAPEVLLLANLGAVQLHTYGPDDCRRLVEGCQADALVVHLNAVQEAVQPGGDTEFGGLLGRIEALCAAVDWPVVAKEVGFGLSADDVRRLAQAGVAGVDVAGAGGTNWARIEGLRDAAAGEVAAAFADWGIPTAQAVRDARAALDAQERQGMLLVASGGLRDGVDALRCLCLGADLAGLGRGLLTAASQGSDEAVAAVAALVRQLQIGVWAVGAADLSELGAHLLDETGP